MKDAGKVTAAELVRPGGRRGYELDPLAVLATDGDLTALNLEGAVVCRVMEEWGRWGTVGGPYTHLMFHAPTTTFWLVHLEEASVTT